MSAQQQHQMAMQGMGGPVAPPNNAGTPTNSSNIQSIDPHKRLNTAIYEYLLCHQKYDAARQFKNAFSGEIEFADSIKQSPGQRQANGVDGMDVDSKDHIGVRERPNDLPAPQALSSEEGPFLQDWWVMFWDLHQGNRQKGRQTVLSYVGQQRNSQKMRTNLMAMDPSAAQRGYMMNGQDMRQQVLKNGVQMNPQAQAQLAMMKQRQAQNPGQAHGEQMQRQGSQMDMNAARSGSPNTGGDAPSPKRQRMDGNMQQQINQSRPGQPGPMPGGNQGMPQNPQMGPGGAQSSPMNQQAMENQAGEFYPQQRMGMPQNGAAVAAAGGQAANNGNHALQDYQMQLMLLEQQNKKRLLMARQEQDSMAHPTGVPGPNGGQFAPGMSPQGSRAGDPSPNPNDMQRGTPNVKKMGGSPNGDMTGRGSPQPGMMDPNGNPAMRPQMIMGPNGQPMMRPPSSHPMAGQQMTPHQLEIMQRQQQGQMMQNGPQFQGGPQGPGGQMMPGQQPGQPGQPPNMTPRQGHMPPPPAPQNPGGTQPSSPAQQPAPPTPNQANKPKPGAKKEAANKKAAPNKKGPAGGDNADGAAPPTPTPQAPQTPQNAASFNQNKNMSMANGQPAPNQANNGQPGAPPVQQPDMNGPPFGNIGGDDTFGGMDFANLDTGDVLDNFDFDSFLNSNGDGNELGFDANFAFGDGQELDMGTN